jgi:hypothetical protein
MEKKNRPIPKMSELWRTSWSECCPRPAAWVDPSNQVLGPGGMPPMCADWIPVVIPSRCHRRSTITGMLVFIWFRFHFFRPATPLAESPPPPPPTAADSPSFFLWVSYENGRTYHRYKDGAYLMPNDEVMFLSLIVLFFLPLFLYFFSSLLLLLLIRPLHSSR